MPQNSEIKHIIIIDRKNRWRKLSEEALKAKGFSVHLLDDYDYPLSTGQTLAGTPNLVILGCTTIGPPELKLIGKVLKRKHHLVVLCTALPRQVMRSLFLIGADDVVDRPYDADDLIEVVEQALKNIEGRDSFQVVKKEGLL